MIHSRFFHIFLFFCHPGPVKHLYTAIIFFREAIPIKNLLPFGIFQKGGGSCLNPKVLRNFFVLFMFGHFFRRGGRLPKSKLFEEFFCLCLEIFQGRGWGYLIPKMMRYFFLLSVRHFPMKIGEGDQNPNTLRNFSSYKIRF